MTNNKIRTELEIKGKDDTGPAFRSVAARMGQIEKQLSRFNRTATQFNSKVAQIERATKGMDRVSRGMQANSELMVGSLKALGTVAAGAYLKDAVMSFADLERRMTRIGITAEASAEDTKKALETIQHETKALGLPLDQGINAMDTLVASGMRLEEALAFLPAVLTTTQAQGAAAEDIANAGLKTASAFKIEAKDMQKAFDDMAYSAQNGQFELRNMAQYLPSLSTEWATLGYKGEEGLKRLLGMLQTLRAHTGTNEQAANWAENIMLKMTSPETINKFAKFHIDLMGELDKAVRNGEDKLHAFVRLSMQATKGDIEKFNQIFQDSQLQLGMKVLASFPEELAKNIEILNSTQVDGTNVRNLQRIIDDTQSSIERFNQSYETFKQKIGGRVAPVATWAMDTVSQGIDVGDAKDAGMKKLGWGIFRRMTGPVTQDEWLDVLHAGGYDTPEFRQAWQGKQMRNMVGRGIPTFVPPPEFPGGDHGYTPKTLPMEGPIPGRRDSALRENLDGLYKGMKGRGLPGGVDQFRAQDFTATVGAPGAGIDWSRLMIGDMADGGGLLDHMKVELPKAGEEAGRSFSDSAGSGLLDRAAEAGSAFGRAAADTFNSAIRGIQATFVSPNGNPGVNADVGKSNAAGRPTKFGERW